jgi:hypothetical protein
VIAHLTTGRMIELAVAVLLIGAGIWFYRRPGGDGRPSTQGPVIMFVIAAILGAHALGLMDYRPSQAEREAMLGGAQ